MREPSPKMISDAVEHLCLAGLPPSSRSFAEDTIRTMLDAEREVCAAKAREFAGHYPAGSDGRNTFILLAEWIERRNAN